MIDVKAMVRLKSSRNNLTPQQYRTLKGQILAGDSEGAMQGLEKNFRTKTESPRTVCRHS